MITQYGFDLYWSQQKAPYEFVNRPSDVSKDLTITGLPCGDDRSCQCDDRYSDSMVRSLLLRVLYLYFESSFTYKEFTGH